MIQSGSCPSRTQAAAETLGATIASTAGCTDAAAALSCLRNKSVAALIDAPADLPAAVRGTRFLPREPRVAISTGSFRRVPIVIGANRDEGRGFATGNIGWTQDQ
jgi:para-nitrobenzyl esterase